MNANSQQYPAGCTAADSSDLAAVAGGQSTVADFLAGFVPPLDDRGRVITHTDASRMMGSGL